MTRPALFLHSVRHTRPRQLLERARLMASRRVLERFPWLEEPRATLEGDEVPPLAAAPPRPIFAARRHLATVDGERTRARLLNLEHPLEPPIAWHPPELEVGTRLGALNLHYMEYLEALEDTAFRAVVLDWIEHNPPYRRGYWLDDWNAYALSIRTVVWMQQIAARGLAPGSAFVGRAAASIARQLHFLERNVERDIGGNHLVKNLKALLWAGSFFTGGIAHGWRDLGERLLDEELGEQVLGDGMHFERSPAYHAQVTADLLECHAALPPGKRRERLSRALERMGQALADLTHPDGAPSLFNDGGLGMTYAPAIVLDAIARSCGAAPRARPVFALADAGYYGVRRDDDLVVVDCGPIGPDHLPAHAHGDVLGFEWSLGGRRLVVDAGVYEYHAGERRARSRGTAAHNTLTLDDRDQAEFWSAFRVGRRPQVTLRRFEPRADGFVLEGAHDGYARLDGAPMHLRRFEVSGRRIAVDDRVEGGRGQRARARLLLAPEAGVRLRAGGAELEIAGRRITLATSAAVSVEKSVYWPDFGVEIPTCRLALDYGPAPCAGGFVLEA